MTKRTATPIATISILLGILVIAPASAQPSTATDAQEVISQHHQRLYLMMKDMTQAMTKMTEQMSRGVLTPEQQAEMSQRMASMATIMQRMSGLEARPAMSEADWQRQMDQMRTLMDEMMRNWQMAPATK